MGRMPESVERDLRSKHYGVWGHSAVQVCSWTKESLTGGRDCYKKTFYGADTHRCVEFSPAAVFCGNNCTFCWRPMEFMGPEMREADDPEDIINNLLMERKKLMSGFPGNEKVSRERFREAMDPSHFAISLSGEPTLYPRLPALIRLLKSRPATKSVFLVTNAQNPGMLARLKEEDALPTQIYISTNAPGRTLFNEICRPSRRDGWERFLESLDVVSGMDARIVMRMTMMRGKNMDDSHIPGYAGLVKRLKPHFTEVKAYMHIGYSRNRLSVENMPFHHEIRSFSDKLCDAAGLEKEDEREDSRIVLLTSPERRTNRFIERA